MEEKEPDFETRKKEMMGEIKSPEQLVGEILGEKGFVTLEGLHNKYKELLYIEDTNRIDVVLATALSNKLEGIPIWLILVGASGDMKSVQLNAIEGFFTHYLHKITSKTLVNGYRDKVKFPDLAPKLDGKIVVIRDMAPLLKLPTVEKAEVWGQLRDLYDGFAGAASGMGADIKYKDLRITLIAGSTPAIDGQILVHQDLGTRELVYRTKGNLNKQKVMNKCLENEEFEEKINKELNEITLEFLNKIKIKRDIIPKHIIEEIKRISLYVTYMRATADIDSYTGELRNYVYPEEPTRIIKQLKRLYICLMSLAEDYQEQTAINILWEVGKGSSFPLRINLFEFMLKQEMELSTSRISELMETGKKTAKRELSVLMGLGIVRCRLEATSYPDKFIELWGVNKEHPFVKTYNSSPKAVT